MKKITIEFKYVMILLTVVIGVMLAVSGTFVETKTVTAYKTTIDGSDSARVAKWDVVGLTRNDGAQNLSLNAGFNKEVKEGGNWYFEIENKSEVAARINKSSTIKFRLLHSTFKDNPLDQITWNFINGNPNPINFNIYAYNASAETLLSYKHNETSVVITHSQFGSLTTQEKHKYTEIFDKGDCTETLVGAISDNTLRFTKKSEYIEGELVYFYEASIDLKKLTDNESLLGFNTTKSNTTFRVEWSVSGEGENTIPQEVLNRLYYKYVVSNKNYELGYNRIYDTNLKDNEGNSLFLHKSSSGLDFYSYLKYTSSLGGQPMFEFLNSAGTQTVLVAYDKLSQEQINMIKSYSKTTGLAQQAWEIYTYEQYKIFASDNIILQNNLAYMSYGLKVQLIFDLTVEQVD